MASLKVEKLLALPAPAARTTSTLYIVQSGSDQIEMYVTASTGSPPATRHMLTASEVSTMIANAMSNGGRAIPVADIAARDALTPVSGLIALVLDATGDATVLSGAATYVYTGSAWAKISEAESMDVIVQWANISGRPTSSVAAIDAAVGSSHSHSNKAVLDKFTESGGVPLYNGAAIPVNLAVEEW